MVALVPWKKRAGKPSPMLYISIIRSISNLRGLAASTAQTDTYTRAMRQGLGKIYMGKKDDDGDDDGDDRFGRAHSTFKSGLWVYVLYITMLGTHALLRLIHVTAFSRIRKRGRERSRGRG